MPLDIIVNSGNVTCLVTLLTHMSLRNNPKLAPAVLLCQMNQPDALSMLLKSATVTHDEVKASIAFHAHGYCVSLLCEVNFFCEQLLVLLLLFALINS